MSKSGSAMVELRLYKQEDVDKDWQEVKVSGYLPMFLTGELNDQNIEKRIRQLYFKRPSDIVKIRWNYRGETETGFDITPD